MLRSQQPRADSLEADKFAKSVSHSKTLTLPVRSVLRDIADTVYELLWEAACPLGLGTVVAIGICSGALTAGF